MYLKDYSLYSLGISSDWIIYFVGLQFDIIGQIKMADESHRRSVALSAYIFIFLL